ncbi:MAG: SH3 domain-containing protein [Syntrophales bacterium]|nr:SH3 domain-containing protein [Syntrophales bacterium]
MKHITPHRFASFPLLFMAIIVVSGCAAKEKLYYAAPTLLPGTQRAMKIAGFWEGRHPFPDKLILDSKGINRLNLYVQDALELTHDITRLPYPLPRDYILSKTNEITDYYVGLSLYHEDGSRITHRFYEEMKARMDLISLPSGIDTRYGLVVRYTDQRVFPTSEAAYAKSHDIDFDELQNSALDIGTPVAVVHASLDGKWFYVMDPLNAGWVPVEAVALCSLDDLKKFIGAEPFAVVTRPKGEVFLDSGMRAYYDYARMGVRLPIREESRDGIAVIRLPLRGEDGSLSEQAGYIREDDIHQGYLPYTPRTIIRQAFELINAPYGWGGMYGEQDCSRFVQEIFATVGVSLPRNSSKQSQVGDLLGEYPGNTAKETKLDILSRKAIGGCTLLYLRGHIMLFLGTIEGTPYAIHSTWGYREPLWWGERTRVINRVAVTNLSLGEGSKKGSYLERLRSIRLISFSDPQKES